MTTRAPAIIEVRVRPRARASRLWHDPQRDMWRAELKAAPVDGRANEELVALVAAHFGCRKAAVSIKSGAAGRTKLVRIDAG